MVDRGASAVGSASFEDGVCRLLLGSSCGRTFAEPCSWPLRWRVSCRPERPPPARRASCTHRSSQPRAPSRPSSTASTRTSETVGVSLTRATRERTEGIQRITYRKGKQTGHVTADADRRLGVRPRRRLHARQLPRVQADARGEVRRKVDPVPARRHRLCVACAARNRRAAAPARKCRRGCLRRCGQLGAPTTLRRPLRRPRP